MSDAAADADHDGWDNGWEYALGTNPVAASSVPPLESGFVNYIEDEQEVQILTVTLVHPADRENPAEVEQSSDLTLWQPAELVNSEEQPDGQIADTWRVQNPGAGQRFFLKPVRP